MTPSETQHDGAQAASELLARRTQLQEWLQRLDSVDDDIPPQVKRRVRADYEQRLAGVVAELGIHSESLTADREVLEERLLAAAERYDAAHESLEEVRLRHRIGEISEQEWQERRPALEEELEAAKSERGAIDQEIATLEDLLFQLGAAGAAAAREAVDVAALQAGPEEDATLEEPSRPWTASAPAPAPAPPPAPAPEAEPSSPEEFAAEADDWDPELPEIEVPADWPPVPGPAAEAVEEAPPAEEPAAEAASAADESPLIGADPLEAGAFIRADEHHDDLVEITTFAAAAEALAEEVDPAPADDDYAFLQELDRAIAATAPAGETAEAEEEAPTRPQAGLKCPDCGYSNDPAAWYCGVCGVDLG